MGSYILPAFLVSVDALQIYNCLVLRAPIIEIGSVYPTSDWRGNRPSKTLY